MSKDRWTIMESVIEQALALTNEKREEFLNEKCGNDQDLRDEIESLLKYSDQATSFIRQLADKIELVPLNDLIRQHPFISNVDDLKILHKSVSHFDIIEKLGSGGMGVVYKALDTRLERTVALKFLPPGINLNEKNKQRFLREAKAAAAINHPNICQVYSVGEFEGRLYIEMEYIQGTTFRETLSTKSNKIPVLIQYARQIIDALAAAHDKGVIHRDIKPENIMVDDHDRIKVMDFGLAKLKGSQDLTMMEGILGTIAYMSPEQIRGAEVDVRSDLFSFGIILYEMITGKHPFASEYEQATAYRLVNEDPLPPSSHLPQIPPKLNDIIRRCLEKNPDHRYQSAVDILRDLKEVKKDPRVQTTSTYSDQRQSIPGLHIFNRKTIKWTVRSGILIIMIGVILFYPRMLEVDAMERIPDEKGIVVLPFVNHSEDMITPAMNNGIYELLVSRITQMEKFKDRLWVVPTTEVREQSVTSASQAARIFGVNLAVTGSLHQSGEQLRLLLNLTDAITLRQLDSKELEFDYSQLTALQNETHIVLAQMIELELEPEAEKSILAGGSQDPRAYELYLLGRGELTRYEDPDRISAAIRKFEEAIEADAGFVLAYAGLGEAYWRNFDLTMNPQWAEDALRYSQIALELNDEVPEVYSTMAMIYNGMNRYEDALIMLEVLELKYGYTYDTLVQLGRTYEGLGNIEQAELTYLRAIENRKTFWGGYNELGHLYFYSNRLEEAATQFRIVTELTPDNTRGYNNLGGTLVALGKDDEAIPHFINSLSIRPNYDALSNLGTLYFRQRKFPDAISMYERAIEIENGLTDYRIWSNLATAYYWTGEDSGKVNRTIHQTIKLAEGLREIRPEDPALLSHLAGQYAMVGNRDKAMMLLDQLTIMQIRSPDIMITIGSVYEFLGERDMALNWIERALGQGYDLQNMRDLISLQELLSDPRLTELQMKYQSNEP